MKNKKYEEILKDWEEAVKATDEAWEVVKATPEYKNYKEADKVADEAWEAWAATPEFKDYLKVVKTYEAACMKKHGEREE